MQKDQVSLLFIPMRFVETALITLDGAPFAEMTGSISLSENASLSVSIPENARTVEVTMTDTEGAVTRAKARRAGY